MTVERTLTPAFREAMEKQETEAFPLIFLRIRHPSLVDEIRLVRNGSDVVLNASDTGELVYKGADFQVNILSDGEGSATAQLQVQNVDLEIGNALIDAFDPARIDLEIYSSALFNESVVPHPPIVPNPAYEFQALYLFLVEASIRDDFVTGTLRGWDYTQETYPGIVATEDRFPGLFW